MANRDAVLMAVLECGTADLELLDDVEYDLGGIVEDLYGEDVKPTLNAIMERVFRKGVEELKGHLADEISHSEGAYSDDPDYEETVRLNEKLWVNCTQGG